MNSKGHLVCSLLKSLLRIVGCGILVFLPKLLGIRIFAISFLSAEVLGVLEELLDMR